MGAYEQLISRNKQFEFPNQYVIDEMDLIDLRRKIMKWCAKSQGAIEPCRKCPSKCSAGIRALALYDGIDAPKASEPAVAKNNINETKKETKPVPKEEKKEVNKLKEKRKPGRPVSKWYEEAMASSDPVKWCVDNLGITVQQAKKRIYMYEYNRFGAKRTKKTDNSVTVPGPVVKIQEQPVMKTENTDASMIDIMQTEMQMLVKKQEEYKTQIDNLTEKHKKVTDRIEAITMCIELYKDKLSL